jgi:serine/threonine protein kinase
MVITKRLAESEVMSLPFEQPTSLASQLDVIKCLGIGRVGVVYLCKSVRPPHQLVALKVLSPIHLASGPDDRMFMRFRNEILSMFRVRHENVIRIYEYICEPDLLAYSMEYMDGGTLQGYLETREQVNIDHALLLLRQLCAGTQAIHEAGIVHRDLKPENILLSADHHIAKVTDFGVSFSEESPKITAHGDAVGTVRYLSPEYLEQGVTGPRGDIYALGVMAYYMLTGVLPHYEAGLFHTVSQKISTDPPPAHVVNRDCPYELSAIIQRAMARDASVRFESAGAFGEALKTINLSFAVSLNGSLELIDRKVATPSDMIVFEPASPPAVTEEREFYSIGRFFLLAALGIFGGSLLIFIKAFFSGHESFELTHETATSDWPVRAPMTSLWSAELLPVRGEVLSDWIRSGTGLFECIDPSHSSTCEVPQYYLNPSRRTQPEKIVESETIQPTELTIARVERRQMEEKETPARSKVQEIMVPHVTTEFDRRSKNASRPPVVAALERSDKSAERQVQAYKAKAVKPEPHAFQVERPHESVFSQQDRAAVSDTLTDVHTSLVERFTRLVSWRSSGRSERIMKVCAAAPVKVQQALLKRLAGREVSSGVPYQYKSVAPERIGSVGSGDCDFIYISGNSASNLPLIVSLTGRGVITVTEGTDAGVFGIVSASYKTRFTYNEKLAQKMGVKVKPIVLSLASRVIR